MMRGLRSACRSPRRARWGAFLVLLLLTAASLAWSEGHPAWSENSWCVLWALGLASLINGVVLVRLAPARPFVRLPLALLVVVLLALGQVRSLELLLMLAAWSLSGFAP
jgi:hypothetical protein